MQRRLKFRSGWFALKAFFAGVAGFSYLLALLVVASPGLHQFAHRDAANPDHHCVVTELSQGNQLSEHVPAVLLTATLFPLLLLPELPRPCASWDRVHLGRGPPVFGLLLAR